MTITIRHAKVEDAHVIAEAEREITKEPGFFCSQLSEFNKESIFIYTQFQVYIDINRYKIWIHSITHSLQALERHHQN